MSIQTQGVESMPGDAQTVTALELRGVSKSYAGVPAVTDCDLIVSRGEVHALVGENGAGKSTLIGIATGALESDSGTVRICSELLAHPDPRAARRLGLAVVNQHPSLLPDLTVEENLIFATLAADRPGLLSRREWALEVLATCAGHVDPRVRVDKLSLADKHLVEIAKALAARPDVLLLDEPTEPLNADQCELLFGLIADLATAGTAVVYISHRIPDVLRVSDRVTVLRDGRIRGTMDASALDEQALVTMIVGRELESTFPPKRDADADGGVVLEVEGLRAAGLDPFSLNVAEGEIVGLAGVAGNGQADCLRALAGLGSARGTVRLGGREISVSTPQSAAGAGIAYVPDDRHVEGVAMDMSTRENAAISSLPRYRRWGWLRRAPERAGVARQFADLSVKTPSLESKVYTLSGGNQQKVVFARCLMAEPKVLLANEPTQGVDAGARVEIYNALRDAARRGIAVVLASSDGVELEGLCDRVLVFSRGQVVSELTGDEVTEHAITGAAVTSTALRETSDPAHRGGFWRRFVAGDYLPAAILLALGAVLAGLLAVRSDGAFSTFNIQSILLLASALGFAALGQLFPLMLGGIDLSVGPLMGLGLVTCSFVLATSTSGSVMRAVVLVLAAGLAVGVVNAALISLVGVTPVVATLVTYIALQGISLALRPTPDGLVDYGFIDAIQSNVGAVPLAFVALVVITILADLWLRFSPRGITLRAVGSDSSIAGRVGASPLLATFAAYIACSLFAAVAALLMTAQIGVGDATSGVGFTLTSITAVVLGGVSVFGGRGAFIPVLLAAVLLQQMINATTFLGLGQAWQYAIVGVVVLGGAGCYSMLRDRAGTS